MELGDKQAVADNIRKINQADEDARIQGLVDEAKYKATTILLTETEIGLAGIMIESGIYGVLSEAIAAGAVTFIGNELTITKLVTKAATIKLLEAGLNKILADKGYIADESSMNLMLRIPITAGPDVLSTLSAVGGVKFEAATYILQLVIKRDYLLTKTLLTNGASAHPN